MCTRKPILSCLEKLDVLLFHGSVNEVQALLPESSRLVQAAAICREFCFPFAAAATSSLALGLLRLCMFALVFLRRLAFRFRGSISLIVLICAVAVLTLVPQFSTRNPR